MANALLSVVNLVDAADTTLTAEDTSGDLSPDRLKLPSPRRGWRSATADSVGVTKWVQADFGVDRSFDTVAVQFWRDGVLPEATDTVQLLVDGTNDTPGSGDVLDVANLISAGAYDPATGTLFYRDASSLSARYVRLSLTLNGARYAEVGRLWVGTAIQPGINVVYPIEQLWFDGGRTAVNARSGEIFSEQRFKRREMGLQFSLLTPAETAALYDAQRIAGTTQQVLVCADPDAPATTAILGQLQDESPFAEWTYAHGAVAGRKAYRLAESI